MLRCRAIVGSHTAVVACGILSLVSSRQGLAEYVDLRGVQPDMSGIPEQGLVRSCSASRRDGHCRPLQTILATRIVTSTKDKTLSGLLQGARFVVGEANLSVTEVVPDQAAIIAAVSKNLLTPLWYRL